MGRQTKKVKVGSILLTEWLNEAHAEGRDVLMKNITINRLYKSKETGKYAYGSQFREVDLPHIAEAIHKYNNGECEVINAQTV